MAEQPLVPGTLAIDKEGDVTDGWLGRGERNEGGECILVDQIEEDVAVSFVECLRDVHLSPRLLVRSAANPEPRRLRRLPQRDLCSSYWWHRETNCVAR